MDQRTEKTCCTCGESKPVADFHRCAGKPDGHAAKCKVCTAAYDREYRQRNIDHLKALNAAYYVEHRDDINARLRKKRREDPDFVRQERERWNAWYARNRAREVERSRQWRLAHPEQFEEYRRRWRKRNPEKVREWSRARMARLRAEDPEGMAKRIRDWRQANQGLVKAAKAAWIASNYERHRSAANQANRRWKKNNPDKVREADLRRRAMKAQVSFRKIDLAEIWELQEGCCGICGTKMNRELRWPDPLSPSIDHIVPLSKGGSHSQENVTWACLVCNLRKGTKLPDGT